MAVCQNLVPLVNIKIAGKWMFIPLKMVLIGIDPYPYIHICNNHARPPALPLRPPWRGSLVGVDSPGRGVVLSCCEITGVRYPAMKF